MPETKCWLCHMYFEFGANNNQPYLWHEHPNGSLVANENPNIKRQPRKWYHSNPTKPKKTFWQDWQHFEPKIGDRDE